MALQVPLHHKYCTCTDEYYNPTPLGKLQKQFEELRKNGLSIYEALEKMKIKKLCCRESLFNPPIIFMNSENVGRILDEAGHIKKMEIGKMRKRITTYAEDTPPIEPKKALPELP